MSNDNSNLSVLNSLYRVSVKAVIRNDKGEILLNKEYDSTTWNLPGGGWEHGETENEALARELKEEVGYSGAFTAQIIGTDVVWLESKGAYLLWLVYDVKAEDDNFNIGRDSTEVAFIHPLTLSEESKSHAERWIKKNLG